MTDWLDPTPIHVPEELRAAVGGHPLVAELLARRGITDPRAAQAFLDPQAYTPASPYELPGMAAAAARLESALRDREPVLVWGDFDVDGQTATTLLVSTLRALGGEVRYHIPVRAGESHGISLAVLQDLLARQPARLLLTCDTGISAHASIAWAREQGIAVIVTDHHALPEKLPEAEALVNPRLLPAGHPLGTLPGVGVAYKLSEALYSRAGREAEAGANLDLVALGIVADVAEQVLDARYLLQRGLQVLRQNRRPGLQALLELNELAPEGINEETIGFLLGPSLNALGRLGDANPVVEFFTTPDAARARILALQLHGLNVERRLLTSQVMQGALALVDREPDLLREPALVLAHPAWPAGIIGIVAGRLVERFGRPVILLTAPPGEPARGSARSVPGVDITAAIAAQGDLLLSFGGHPMAAGLSLDAEAIPEFRRRLSHTLAARYGEQPPATPLQVDAELRLGEAILELAQDLERLAPFGAGNPAPVFAIRSLKLTGHSPLGRDGEHLQLLVEDESGAQRRVFWWGAGGERAGGEGGAAAGLPSGPFDLAVSLRPASYRGQAEARLTCLAVHPLSPVEEMPAAPSGPEILDYRGRPQPLALLEALRASGGVQVWAEGEARTRLEGRSREELAPGERLAIWTAPPGPRELQAALESARPQTVILFGFEPETGSLPAFLTRLAGLVKYTLSRRAGRAGLAALAAATAQREAAVREGLKWLAARGDIRDLAFEGDEVCFSAGSGQAGGDGAGSGIIEARLQAILEETKAYRQFFGKVDWQALF